MGCIMGKLDILSQFTPLCITKHASYDFLVDHYLLVHLPQLQNKKNKFNTIWVSLNCQVVQVQKYNYHKVK